MNHRTALGALHIGALFFGLTGVFGKLATSASPVIIVFGRAAFAVVALALFASVTGPGWQRLNGHDARRLLLGGVLLGWGAMTGIGCTVGTLLSGGMAGALSGWVFGAAMLLVLWLGFRWQTWWTSRA